MSGQWRVKHSQLGTVLDGMEPCENCGTPVTVITMTAPNREDVTRLMDGYADEANPHLVHMDTHTPERCRDARKKAETP